MVTRHGQLARWDQWSARHGQQPIRTEPGSVGCSEMMSGDYQLSSACCATVRIARCCLAGVPEGTVTFQ